jgi:carboxymethylenebutenolidase
MQVLVLAMLAAALALNAFGAEGKPVTYKSGDETVKGILFQPAGKGPFPALVVIHEFWGLNDWVKEQASKLADQGYAALAIDLYRGKVAGTPDEAHELVRGVPPDRATQDLKAAFDFLAAQNIVDSKRIGDIGWCMGGGYALDLAIAEPRLKAAVINYGHLATDPERQKAINASILGIFGGKDRGIPVADVRKLEEQVKSVGETIEIIVYPDAGHAFENPNNKAGYRGKDAADAWNRTTAFLQTNLKK